MSPVSPGFQELICGFTGSHPQGLRTPALHHFSLQIEPKSFPIQAEVFEVFLPGSGVLTYAGLKDLGVFPRHPLLLNKSDFRVLSFCEEQTTDTYQC